MSWDLVLKLCQPRSILHPASILQKRQFVCDAHLQLTKGNVSVADNESGYLKYIIDQAPDNRRAFRVSKSATLPYHQIPLRPILFGSLTRLSQPRLQPEPLLMLKPWQSSIGRQEAMSKSAG
jgi:hypothetical protein